MPLILTNLLLTCRQNRCQNSRELDQWLWVLASIPLPGLPKANGSFAVAFKWEGHFETESLIIEGFPF